MQNIPLILMITVNRIVLDYIFAIYIPILPVPVAARSKA